MAVFDSVKELLAACEAYVLPLWETVQSVSSQQADITKEESWDKMRYRLQVMHQACVNYDPLQHSASGLVGGDAQKVRSYYEEKRAIGGDFMGRMLSYAIMMGECNACMHRIVAAPTAGACGVIPAVLLAYADTYDASEEELIRALYVTAGFGMVIANRASISGAEAGCQAEIGSASAMAAAALVHLHGGDAVQMAHACAIALKNMMGLVCDPVAGLVEVPCVKRNAAGAMNALCAAELALAGVQSRIPCDEVIDAMRVVGDQMHADLRETGRGGIAGSPTAQAFAEKFFGT